MRPRATECWDTRERIGVARCKLGLAEEGRLGFEKSNLITLTYLASDDVEEMDGEY
jgi:hypothetical protein